MKRYYLEVTKERDELDAQVKILTRALEDSLPDSEEGLRAKIGILKKQQDWNEINTEVKILTRALANSPLDSERGLRAEIGLLKKQQDWNEKQIQYWMEQCNGRPSSATGSSTLIGSPNPSLRSSLTS